jgi:hypothetical protein
VIVRLLVIAGAFALAVLVAAVATTSWDTEPVTVTSGRLGMFVPDWTRPCRRTSPVHGTRYILACARVHGRVVYREDHDPDGDLDRHLVVISGLRLVTIKIPREAQIGRLPGIGSSVTATGILARGHRHGLEVVRVGTLTSP